MNVKLFRIFVAADLININNVRVARMRGCVTTKFPVNWRNPPL